MFESGPSADELEALGFTADYVGNSNTEVWQENWLAYEVFTTVSGQWRMSMGGPVALDYSVVIKIMGMFGVRKPKKQLALLNDLRIMEQAALSAIASNKD